MSKVMRGYYDDRGIEGRRTDGKAYVVMRGYHDDKHIVAVFSTPEKAGAYARTMRGSGPPRRDDPWLEEHDFDPKLDDDNAPPSAVSRRSA